MGYIEQTKKAVKRSKNGLPTSQNDGGNLASEHSLASCTGPQGLGREEGRYRGFGIDAIDEIAQVLALAGSREIAGEMSEWLKW